MAWHLGRVATVPLPLALRQCNMILANVTGTKFSIESIDECGIRPNPQVEAKIL
jgi:hypothetical protein